MSSIVGAAVAALVSFRIEAPYVVTAGKGVSFSSLQHSGGAYQRSLNDAVTAISSLNLGHEAIANLDWSNPFPVLFWLPHLKGIRSFGALIVSYQAVSCLNGRTLSGAHVS